MTDKEREGVRGVVRATEDVDGYRAESNFTDLSDMPVFEECEVCAAKPGAPLLCRVCRANRATVEYWRERARTAEARTVERIAAWLESQDGDFREPAAKLRSGAWKG